MHAIQSISPGWLERADLQKRRNKYKQALNSGDYVRVADSGKLGFVVRLGDSRAGLLDERGAIFWTWLFRNPLDLRPVGLPLTGLAEVSINALKVTEECRDYLVPGQGLFYEGVGPLLIGANLDLGMAAFNLLGSDSGRRMVELTKSNSLFSLVPDATKVTSSWMETEFVVHEFYPKENWK